MLLIMLYNITNNDQSDEVQIVIVVIVVDNKYCFFVVLSYNMCIAHLLPDGNPHLCEEFSTV